MSTTNPGPTVAQLTAQLEAQNRLWAIAKKAAEYGRQEMNRKHMSADLRIALERLDIALEWEDAGRGNGQVALTGKHRQP